MQCPFKWVENAIITRCCNKLKHYYFSWWILLRKGWSNDTDQWWNKSSKSNCYYCCFCIISQYHYHILSWQNVTQNCFLKLCDVLHIVNPFWDALQYIFTSHQATLRDQLQQGNNCVCFKIVLCGGKWLSHDTNYLFFLPMQWPLQSKQHCILVI